MSGEAEPLPRGRHGIDRDTVRAHQRTRIIDATIECVAERGYIPTTVGHIVARAHVSRETFYELFPDKETCYRESLNATIGVIFELYGEATGDDSQPPLVRLERGLRAYFQALADRPSLTTCFVLERPSERPLTREEAESRQESIRRFHDVFGTQDEFTINTYLSLVDGFVRRYVAADRIDELPATVDQLIPIVARVLELDDA